MCNKDLDQDLYIDQGKDKNYQLWLNLDKNLDQDLVKTVSMSGKTTKSLNWMTHYSSGPNKHVHTPICFRNKIPPHMALLGTTHLLIFQRKSKKKPDYDF